MSSTTSTRMPRRSGVASNRRSACASASPRATVNMKALPLPASLSTRIVPPIISTSCLEMASPSPVPPNSRVVDVSAWEKDSNSRLCCSGVMPMPLSRTENSRVALSPACSTSPTETITSPDSVNFTALLVRLISTWPNRRGSPSSWEGTSAARENSSSRPFSRAFPELTVARFSSTSSRAKGRLSMSSLPASILEKSRISLMMPSRDTADACTLLR